MLILQVFKPTVMIKFYAEDCNFKLKHKRLVGRWLKSVAASEDRKPGAINYIFCSDPYLLDINKQYLGHDYYTDIITFDNSEDFSRVYTDKNVSADIYISVDTVRANGQEYGEGFNKELHRVIVHGLLHLIGYDDHTEAQKKDMRAAENRALKVLETMAADDKVRLNW